MHFNQLFGIAIPEFFKTAWETCLSFSRTNVEFSDIARPLTDWSPALLERIVLEGDMIMVKDSQFLKQSFFVEDGKADLTKIFFLWSEGFTFYARNLSAILPSMKTSIELLEAELYPMKVEANIFLTPGGQTGFLPHFDCHDVFVIQLAGEKHWKFWNAFKQDMDYSSPTIEDQARVDEIVASRPPDFERTLRKNDVCHIPRGAIHGPSSLSFSSHLTFWLKAPLAEKVALATPETFRVEEHSDDYF